MNDRIRQLAEQAGLIADQDTKEGWQEYINDVGKFAELIVRRVISVYNDTETFKTSTYDDKRVLEYFGVEE